MKNINQLKYLFQDQEATISQQQGLSREYDRLADENAKLQKLMDSANKKDD